jgi:hypothetical protein
MIPMKQNDIPALIVSTPGFGLAPCRGRYGIGLPLLARLGPPKVGHSRADPAVESLAVPVARPLGTFLPSPPPCQSGETVALFPHLPHPHLLFPTRSVALFREKNCSLALDAGGVGVFLSVGTVGDKTR